MQVATDSPSVPLLKYPGSKHTLARWIVSHIPAGIDSYGEPYCGSAAVLFAKPRSRMETINDKSGEVWNFLTTIRDHEDELIRAIRWTPWAAKEHEICLQSTEDPVERARRFYFRCWSSFRPFDRNPSFRRQYIVSRGRKNDRAHMTTAARQFMRVDHLHWYAERLRGVCIETMEALEFIERYDYDRSFLYVDPPYVYDTRGKGNYSVYEVDDMGDADHADLADLLNEAAGMVAVSGYACPLYAELYEARGWKRADRVARIDGGGSAVESLWLSPRTAEALEKEKEARERLPLLTYGGLYDRTR